MSDAPDLALRRVQRSVLLGLGLCALTSAAGAFREPSDAAPAPPAAYVAAAVALALMAILGRGPARRAPLAGARLHALRLSLLAAGGLGLLGLVLGATEGLWRAALLYTVAGTILAIRPLPRLPGAGRPPGGPDPAP